jgi:PAS domain S-box-containing protein
MPPSEPSDWFPATAQEGLRLFWRAAEPRFLCELQRLRAALRAGSDGSAWLHAPEQDAARDELLLAQVQRGIAGDFGPFAATVAEAGTRWARAALALTRWHEAIDDLRSALLGRVIEAYVGDTQQLAQAVSACSRLGDMVTRIVAREYVQERERALVAQRLHTQQALERFSRLAESGIIGILVSDIFGNPKEANDAFLQMVGYTREEFFSKVTWTAMTPPEWRHLDEAAIEQLKTCGRTRPWEKEYLRKDGSRVPILVGVAQLNQTEGIAFVLDISERKHLEELRLESEALLAQNERIREASRLKSEFVANMSHELRTPLTAILGFAELLQDHRIGPDKRQYDEFLGHILKSGGHLLQLITDVLDLAKVEAGKLEFHPESFELQKLVREVCELSNAAAEQKQIQLTFEVQPALTHVTLDPVRLKQVLFNLVSNALKFTPTAGNVRVRCLTEEHDQLRVEVSDDGMGIAESDLPRLFAEFQQLDSGSGKRHGGTGLGLALTRRIVEAQGGNMEVRSKLGQGSTFLATLPCRASGTFA